jgi:hypothetical protein
MRTSSTERRLKRSGSGNRKSLIISKMIAFADVFGEVEKGVKI